MTAQYLLSPAILQVPEKVKDQFRGGRDETLRVHSRVIFGKVLQCISIKVKYISGAGVRKAVFTI